MIFKKYKTIIAILIAISTCCAGSSFFNKKLSNQDHFLSLQQVENKLSADGLYELARCHIYGIGTKKNPEMALPFLERSADHGSSNALNMMGILYRDGLGVEKHHQRTFFYFYAAAKNNNTLAQYNLGMYYYKGWREGKNTVDQDYENAAYWLKIAADKGYHYAQTQLGICYYEGKVFPSIDYTKAAHLFQLASNQGNILGTYYLAKCYEHENGVDQSNEKAFDLYYKASKQRGARFPYLIALTNMVPNQILILLAIVSALIGLWYPWITPIPTRWRQSPRYRPLFFLGHFLLPLFPAHFIARCINQFCGFWAEDKLSIVILTFFYALCSYILCKFEIHKKIYKRKIRPKNPKDTSPKDDFLRMLNSTLDFLWKKK